MNLSQRTNSNILESTGSMLIGRLLFADSRSPSLNKGIIRGHFNSLGKVPFEKNSFKSLDRVGANVYTCFLQLNDEMQSLFDLLIFIWNILLIISFMSVL